MANSFGNQNQAGRPANGSFSYNGNYQNNRNSVPPVRNPGARPWFRYRPGVHVFWTAEEDAILEESLIKFASDCNIARYAKISKVLHNKTVVDVAARCIMRMRKQNGKRRKVDRVSNGRKEQVTNPSASSFHLAGQPGLHANGVVTRDNANGTSYSAIGGATGQLLQQNGQAYKQISANLRANKREQNGNRKVDRVSNGRKEQVTNPPASSFHLAGQPGLHANGVVTSDNANGTSYSAIGGATGQLLQQNDQAFKQISANLRANKFHENVALLSQARDNILKILTNLNDTQEGVELKRMPLLPVEMNEELSKLISPQE